MIRRDEAIKLGTRSVVRATIHAGHSDLAVDRLKMPPLDQRTLVKLMQLFVHLQDAHAVGRQGLKARSCWRLSLPIWWKRGTKRIPIGTGDCP